VNFAVLEQPDGQHVAGRERDRAESRRNTFQRVLEFIFIALAPIHGLRPVDQNVDG
jgi:hypothetical protein